MRAMSKSVQDHPGDNRIRKDRRPVRDSSVAGQDGRFSCISGIDQRVEVLGWDTQPTLCLRFEGCNIRSSNISAAPECLRDLICVAGWAVKYFLTDFLSYPRAPAICNIPNFQYCCFSLYHFFFMLNMIIDGEKMVFLRFFATVGWGILLALGGEYIWPWSYFSGEYSWPSTPVWGTL
jgi:hypothetical protein